MISLQCNNKLRAENYMSGKYKKIYKMLKNVYYIIIRFKYIFRFLNDSFIIIILSYRLKYPFYIFFITINIIYNNINIIL